jgi:hypothetical protein
MGAAAWALANAATVSGYPYGPATLYPAGNSPVAVAIGDFNGDGKPDLAVANQGAGSGADGSVSVLLGRGDGTFAAPVNYLTSGSSQGIALADLNGDRKLDIATGVNFGPFLSSGGGASVLLGHGDGTFATATTTAAGENIIGIVAADFNGDGKLDLALTSADTNTVEVLLGNGDGTFQPAVAYSTVVSGKGTYPESIAAGDFNRDGKIDLAVGSGGSDRTLSILLGNGDGTFGSAANTTVGCLCAGVVAADFNGDGKLDLALSDLQGGRVFVLLGHGDGTFSTPVHFPAVTPQGLAAADVDGDGKLDLVAANALGGHSVSVLLGHGDGTFAAPTDFPTGPDTRGVAVGDLNGDCKPDLAAAYAGNPSANPPVPGGVAVLLSSGGSTCPPGGGTTGGGAGGPSTPPPLPRPFIPPPGWVTPVDVAAGAVGPQVAIDQAGDAIAIWKRGEESCVIGYTYIPHGGQPPEAVPIYSPNCPGPVQAAARPAGQTRFGRPVDLTPPGDVARGQQLAMDARGDAIVVWERERAVGAGWNAEGAVRSLPKFGVISKGFAPAKFDKPVTFGTGEPDLPKPQVAMNARGDALVVWRHLGSCSLGADVQGMERPAGGSFAPVPAGSGDLPPAGNALNACTSDVNLDDPQVAINEHGDAIAYARVGPGQYVYGSLRHAGGGFGAQVAGPHAAQEGWLFSFRGDNLDVAMDARGGLAAVYQPGGSSVSGALGSTDTGFGAPVDFSGQNAELPRVAMDRAGDAVAVWRRTNSSRGTVQASLRPASSKGLAGSHFGKPVDLSAAAQDASLPQVAMNEGGDAVAVWGAQSDLTGLGFIAQVAQRPAGVASRFDSPASLSVTGHEASEEQVAIDRARDVIVVWDLCNQGDSGGSTCVVQAAFSAGLPTDSGVSMATRFPAAQRGASIARRIGTTVSYTDSHAATTTFTVLKHAKGRRRGHCLAPQPGPRRRGRQRCVRYVSVGSFTHGDRAGPNSFRFTGRVGGHKLKPRAYVLQALPRVAGRNGIAATRRFRIIP